MNDVSLYRALSEGYLFIQRFITLDTETFSKYNLSLYWTLSEGYLACGMFRYIGHSGMFVVQDPSLYWTQGYSVYVAFHYIGH